MSANGGGQIQDRVELLQLTRARHCEQARDGEFTSRAAGAEHNLAPLDNDPFILPASVSPERFIIPGIR